MVDALRLSTLQELIFICTQPNRCWRKLDLAITDEGI
ncbi:hypothetical protein Nhal_1668 [Nitrosococcus halophilus Nc 4]|uniref:Uncharacterized protein n=1 Tax=Nitrosococcus halophilus (strain Nc4) TaxID=472759 RepID=D5C2D7_NITHN|nr:hypothetical protein Nhal_1668 [Nitrosococcus halophilus Nc 4]